MTYRSAPTSRASSWLAKSLSITASTPTRVRAPSGRNIVGTPPPPAQMTTTSLSSSQRMGRISKIRLGSGEGTTRRQRSPSGLNTHPFTLARWASAVIGSPRFSSALPPRATTTLIAVPRSLAQGGHHHGLDGVHPVLGLIPDERVLGLEDLVGDLHAVQAELLVDVLADLGLAVVEGRQAVQEPDPGVPGPADHVGVHLVGLEELDPLLPHALVLAHRDPHVGIEVIDAIHALVHVLGEGQPGPGLLGDRATGLDQVLGGPQVLGGAQPDVHAELAAGDHQRIAHVVAGIPQVTVAELV